MQRKSTNLGSTRDHVLNEISMTGSINNGDVVFAGFKLPESYVNGDTAFAFRL